MGHKKLTKKDQVFRIRQAQRVFLENEQDLFISEFVRENRRLELQNLLIILRSELVDFVEAELKQDELDKTA